MQDLQKKEEKITGIIGSSTWQMYILMYDGNPKIKNIQMKIL